MQEQELVIELDRERTESAGLNIYDLSRELRGVYCEGSVCEMVDHKRISNEELLELDVDLLIPAALEGVITRENVDRIKAPIIVEVANGPISGDVDPILEERGIRVVPDVLANAGGDRKSVV